jgi:hypothetical protein
MFLIVINKGLIEVANFKYKKISKSILHQATKVQDTLLKQKELNPLFA